MKLIFKIILLTLFFLNSLTLIYSQSSDGYIIDFRYLLNEDGINLDTLSLKRRYGDFWFGIQSGTNLNLDIGTLKLLRKPYEPYDSIYNKTFIDYFTDYSAGYFFGFIGEWIPKNSMWGATIRVNAFDTWISKAESNKYDDQIQTTYDNETQFKYLYILPSGRYNFTKNISFFAGLDLAISLSKTSYLIRNHIKGGDIKHDYIEFEFKNINTRFGAHIGASYEFEVMDVNQKMRMKAAPFISLHFGTAMITENQSNWNVFTGKVGVAFKLAYDEIEFDTLKYIPKEQPPIILASVDRTLDLNFPEIDLESFRISSGVSAIEGGLTEERLDFEPVLTLNISSRPDIIKSIQEKIDIKLLGFREPKEKLAEKIELPKLITMKAENFSFEKSSSTELSDDLKRYLDNVALYLKNNPGATLGITGHSDNQGTFEENDRRSKERAENVKKYLISKGINPNRLLATWKGSIEPVASNKTESGRKQNRRVEIKIVPAPPKRR